MIDVPLCVDMNQRFVGSPSESLRRATQVGPPMEAVFAAEGTAAFRVRAARECLDTVCGLRAYRQPLAGETWQTPERSERRLLAQVNGIIGMGPAALGDVIERSLDPDIPDPDRVFASVFVLCCVLDRHWLGHAVRILVETSRRSTAETSAATEALGLGPNPAICEFVLPLLDSPDACLRAAAIRVLSFRDGLPEDAWRRAMQDDDASVLIAACLSPLDRYDARACSELLRPMLYRPDEQLVAAALRSGVSMRWAPARQRAIEIIDGETAFADAALYLVLFGNPSDAERVAGLLNGAASRPAIRAAGYFGDPRLVPRLIDLTDAPGQGEAVAAEAAMAVWRITGIPMQTPADVGAIDAHWRRLAPMLDLSARHRIGRLFGPDVLLDLLLEGPPTRPERSIAYLELVSVGGRGVPRFSCHDFVGVQAGALRRIGEWCARGRQRSSASGGSSD